MTTKRERERKCKEPKEPKVKTSAPKTPRKSKSRKKAEPKVVRVPVVPDGGERTKEAPPQREPQRAPNGDLPSVVVKNAAEAMFYFAQIDDRLAEAWKRDVVMHEGPITIRRTMPSWFGSTHYAYVDPRLIWYLKREPSDPLGARWEGYLRNAGDAPRGSMVVMVGRDICAKKCGPQLGETPR